jgi:vacuolar protein 8
MGSRILEALIARGRRVKRPREQREVAFGLADLSTKKEMHVKMVEKGGVVSLMRLLAKSPDQEAQRFASLALGNIASTPENKIEMVDAGVVKPLIDYASNDAADVIGRQYCALCLGNLASDPENHEEIVKLGGLEALVELLKNDDVQCGRYGAFALSNIVSNPEYRNEVVDEGAI